MGQSSVTINSVNSAGSGPVSLDDNPQLEALGLLSPDSIYGNYDASQNLMSSLPATYSSSTSLVAAVQRDESTIGRCGTRATEGNCVDVYHVVTVLDSVPPNAGSNILRPSIDEEVKELLSLDDDFVLDRFPRKSYLTGTDSTGLERIRQRWSHGTELFSINGLNRFNNGFSEGGRAFRAMLVGDEYAGGVAASWWGDFLKLASYENSIASKRPALAAMLTYGKDLFYGIYEGETLARTWGTGAGQHLGKFPAAALFAAFARDTFYADVLGRTSETILGQNPSYGPHELEQVNIGVSGPVWGDGHDNQEEFFINTYWLEVFNGQCYDGAPGTCNPNGGPKNEKDPYGYIDGAARESGAGYQSVSLGPTRGLVAGMFLVPELCEIVNYPPLIEYVDRMATHGVMAGGDVCAPPDPRENPDCEPRDFVNCEYYGLANSGTATWGPNPTDTTQCIHNSTTWTNSGGVWTSRAASSGDANFGQNGRYPNRDGMELRAGYTTGEVEANWSRLRTARSSCLSVRSEKPPTE